jgi:type IV secretory pathway TraG/TraD family ATPase VirD4
MVVVPSLLDYPGSAFVLDLKGETHTITGRVCRTMGQAAVLVDPFGITGIDR